MTTDNQSLPPLPAPYSVAHEDAGSFWPDTFSAQQMRDYGDARAAHAREEALEEAEKYITEIAVGYEFTGNTQAEQAADECLTAIEGLMK